MKKRVRVLTMNAVLGPLDYCLPKGQECPPPLGSFVQVPLGPRTINGIIWDEKSFPVASVPDNKLRPYRAVYPVPPLSAAMRKLICWTADYYLASPVQVARMAMPVRDALQGKKTVTEYRLNGNEPERMTEKRAQAMDALQNEQGSISELAELAGVSDGVIRGLIQQQVFDAFEVPLDSPYPRPNPDHVTAKLNDDQKKAADAIIASVKASKFTPFLLDGVTGSGKTHVYLEAIAEAVRQGKQILLLLPEIALTQPFITRLEARFGVLPTRWHSGLKQSERRRAWQAIANGNAHIVVGARSALFLPYKNLGLVIVDEAHETSFKQEDGVRYNARDIAVMRGKFESCPVVLASATPALESMIMAEAGQYQLLELPARHGGAALPDISIVDLTKNPAERGRWISPILEEALNETLERGEQSLLFLNRRGYAPLTLCRSCGYRFQCPDCSAWMVDHRLSHKLSCHHCGYELPTPDKCPECGEADCLIACGPGVERIADEVAHILPQARRALITSDTVNSPEKADEFVAAVENKLVDVIIGTQLVTKGYHFPDLTLVGVIDADIGLEGGDLRASERTFQQIAQVAGRAGRAKKAGHVYIQSYYPENGVIQALANNDRDSFYERETALRKSRAMPPFGRLAAIIISAEDNKEAMETARLIGQYAPQSENFRVFGPAPAQLSMLRGRYRHRLLVQAKRKENMQAIIHKWLDPLEWPRSVRVAIDVDPYSFV